MKIEEKLKQSHASDQWQKIGIRPHHGVVVPLFSLRSQTSCGIGEYPDLIRLFPWCREIGLDVLQLLPLNDLGTESSPYAAISAFALNPLFLGLTQLPYVKDDGVLQQQIHDMQELNHGQRVDYPAVRTKKEAFLQDYFQKYGTKICAQDSFQNFIKQNPWLGPFAAFKSLKEKFEWQNWNTWPGEYQNLSFESFGNLPQEIKARIPYHIFVQFLCFEQFEQTKKEADKYGIFIKGDIPILINSDSADAWWNSDLFHLEFAAGAPPDMYSLEGQKWGFPLYEWEALAAQGYAWWIERLAMASKGYHLYRLDHIVGFFRIWGIPHDKLAKEGHYIPAEESFWIPQGRRRLQMMLNNSGMLPIGEDLGTVPPPVRVCLRELGICGTKVMRWERRWDTDRGFIDPSEYIPESMTTVSTHDSETLALWWRDQEEEASLYAATFGMEYSPELSTEQRQAILHASHHSGSLFHINLLQEYLALIPEMTWPELEDERINVPGTVSATNWTYRFRPSIEDIVNNDALKKALKQIV